MIILVEKEHFWLGKKQNFLISAMVIKAGLMMQISQPRKRKMKLVPTVL